MTITIQILSTTVETKPTAKGSYQQLEVTYKNLTFNGKVEAKKLMSFGANADAFKTLTTASPASVWDIETFKNNKGYLDWVKVTKGAPPEGGVSTSNVSAQANVRGVQSAPSKGNWETPEERAKKQVYIIRQSSLSTAVAALTASAKTGTVPAAEEIIELAKKLEGYVFDTLASTESNVRQDIESIEEDIPF